MKIFLGKLLVFISIGLLIFILLYIIAEKYDPIIDPRIINVLSKAESIEAIAVGNSHSCALDFKALGIKGYRIALGGNDISEAVYQIKSLRPFLPNLKTVFFNISYFSLYTDNSSIPKHYSIFNKIDYANFVKRYPFVEEYIDTFVIANHIIINTEDLNSVQKNRLGSALDIIMKNTSDRLQIRSNYYNSIPSFTWVRGDFINYLKSRLSVVVRKDHWHTILNRILSSNKYNSGANINNYQSVLDIYGQTNDILRNSYKSKDSLDVLSKDFLAPMYLTDKEIVLLNNSDIMNENLKELISIIKYLLSYEIRIIFYTSPVYKSFTDHFDQSTIKIMREKMHILEKEFGINYFNFSDDSSFTLNNKFFYNSDHLNRAGAKKFSDNFRIILESSKLSLSND